MIYKIKMPMSDLAHDDDHVCTARTNLLTAIFGKDSTHNWGEPDSDGNVTVTVTDATEVSVAA